MSFINAWSEAIQATRMWLDDVNLQISDPQNYSRQTGLLNYLQSGMNPDILNTKMLENAGNSEYRPIEIRYIPHKGQGNLNTDDASVSCSRVNQRRDQIDIVQPTLFVHDNFTIDEAYVRENAENGVGLQPRLQKEIRDSMRVCREGMNVGLNSKLGGLFGANPSQGVGAGNYTEIFTTIAASGKIDDNYWDQIKNDQEDNHQGGDAAIIGKGNARKYMNRLSVGNINDAGIDYREVASDFGTVMFKDDDTGTALSDADNAFVIYPGNTQFLQYSLNKGDDFAIDHGGLIKGTLEDPVMDITWDYILKYDDNCDAGNGLQGAWIGRIFTYYDIWVMPEDAFGDVYSDINDFNGVLGYTFSES